MQSKATTVEQYLSELTEDSRKVLQAVREVILKNLDRDYEEGMQYGMIGYYVPHRVYPAGYDCDRKQPLPFASLASQKNYMSLYLMCLYGDSDHSMWFQQAWAKTGKKLDMGKSCVRFKKLDDLALDVIAEAIRRVPARRYVERCEAALKAMNKRTVQGGRRSRRLIGIAQTRGTEALGAKTVPRDEVRAARSLQRDCGSTPARRGARDKPETLGTHAGARACKSTVFTGRPRQAVRRSV